MLLSKKKNHKKAIDEIIGTKKENLALRRYFYLKNKKIDDNSHLHNFNEIENISNENNDDYNNNNKNVNNNDNDNDSNHNNNINHNNNNKNNNDNHCNKKNSNDNNEFNFRSVMYASSLLHPLSVYRCSIINDL